MGLPQYVSFVGGHLGWFQFGAIVVRAPGRILAHIFFEDYVFISLGEITYVSSWGCCRFSFIETARPFLRPGLLFCPRLLLALSFYSTSFFLGRFS